MRERESEGERKKSCKLREWKGTRCISIGRECRRIYVLSIFYLNECTVSSVHLCFAPFCDGGSLLVKWDCCFFRVIGCQWFI